MVHHFPNIGSVEKICEGCLYGKGCRKYFPVGRSFRVPSCLEIFHTYLSGPMNTNSLFGSRYFLLLTDELGKYFGAQTETFVSLKKIQGIDEKSGL